MTQITSPGRKSLKAETGANTAFVQSVLCAAGVCVSEKKKSVRKCVCLSKRALQCADASSEHRKSRLAGGDVLACLHSFSLSNKEAAAFMATVLLPLSFSCICVCV